MVDCLTKLYSLELKDLKTEQWFEKYGRYFGCRTRRLLRLEGPYLSCHTAQVCFALQAQLVVLLFSISADPLVGGCENVTNCYLPVRVSSDICL
mmetsp:Transcript_25331/g.100036  ORF Transcript_25331/g.100036 Transcript_25331/m.100036 type:complete len:94 (-) Transcript_25331:1618-1899(-)